MHMGWLRATYRRLDSRGAPLPSSPAVVSLSGKCLLDTNSSFTARLDREEPELFCSAVCHGLGVNLLARLGHEMSDRYVTAAIHKVRMIAAGTCRTSCDFGGRLVFRDMNVHTSVYYCSLQQ